MSRLYDVGFRDACRILAGDNILQNSLLWMIIRVLLLL
jgi:hypothetical protein